MIILGGYMGVPPESVVDAGLGSASGGMMLGGWIISHSCETEKYIFLYFLVSAETYLVKSTSNNMFYCKLCEYVAKLRYDVIRHVESKHLDLKYTCYYCNAILKTKRSYQNHLRSYHPNQHHANIQ